MLRSAVNVTLRETLLLLLIVPVVVGWVADRTAKQDLIDRYRWQARALEDAIRTMTDARALTVTDDSIFIETPRGTGKRYPYGTPRTP